MSIKNCIALVLAALAFTACEVPRTAEEQAQIYRTFDGIGPGETAIKNCNTPFCRDLKDSFMPGCMAEAPVGLENVQRSYCQCVERDLFAHNSMQTIVRAFAADQADFALPNIDQCVAQAFRA